jgi:hypothetical protein
MDAEVSTHTFLTMIIEESVCFMSCEPIFVCNYSYLVHTEYIYIFFFINWTLRMSDNLPERVQILCHTHIICITVLENRIICCQIFCDLLLKSAFERIFNVMQLILVKINWHIKWTYLIQKFHIFVFHITLSKFNVYINLAAQYKIELWWCISISYTIHCTIILKFISQLWILIFIQKAVHLCIFRKYKLEL